MQNDPVIPAFPDLHLAPAAILKELSSYFQNFSSQTRLLTLPAPHEIPPRELQEYPFCQVFYVFVNWLGFNKCWFRPKVPKKTWLLSKKRVIRIKKSIKSTKYSWRCKHHDTNEPVFTYDKLYHALNSLTKPPIRGITWFWTTWELSELSTMTFLYVSPLQWTRYIIVILSTEITGNVFIAVLKLIFHELSLPVYLSPWWKYNHCRKHRSWTFLPIVHNTSNWCSACIYSMRFKILPPFTNISPFSFFLIHMYLDAF